MTNRNEFPEFTVITQDGAEIDVRITFADLARLDILRASGSGAKIPPLKDESPLSFVALSFVALKRLEKIEAGMSFDKYLNETFADLLIETEDEPEDS